MAVTVSILSSAGISAPVSRNQSREHEIRTASVPVVVAPVVVKCRTNVMAPNAARTPSSTGLWTLMDTDEREGRSNRGVRSETIGAAGIGSAREVRHIFRVGSACRRGDCTAQMENRFAPCGALVQNAFF